MRRNSKITAIIDDGMNPELVVGAEFSGILDIPVIKAPKTIIIPSGIIPFSLKHRTDDYSQAVGFHEMDLNFADVLRNPESYIEGLSKFSAVISPDCSLYRDAPLAVQITNIYRNRAIGSFFQRHGIYVIPQIRWGSEATYTTQYFPEKIAFLGVEKNSIVAIGTYGCIKTQNDKKHFKAGLKAMLETLSPKVVLVYGAMPDNVFSEFASMTNFVEYPDWTTRMHGGGL